MLVRPLLLAAILIPQAALALPWDGTYRLSEEADCDRVGEEGGALRIAEGVLRGVDSTCRMTEPVDVLDLDATLYEMACEGEGQSWTERAMLMRAAEGEAIFLAWRGYVFRYDRCPEPDAVLAVDDAFAPAQAPEAEAATQDSAAVSDAEEATPDSSRAPEEGAAEEPDGAAPAE
jgi:hypothetical protein